MNKKEEIQDNTCFDNNNLSLKEQKSFEEDVIKFFQKGNFFSEDKKIVNTKSKEKQIRDILTTSLFQVYVDNYINKTSYLKKEREKLLKFCKSIILCLIILSAYLIILFPKTNIYQLGTGITALAGIFTAILGIFKIIVEYVYPKDEEKHIFDIMRLIQENDLMDSMLLSKRLSELTKSNNEKSQ